jgi:hypothetical protein
VAQAVEEVLVAPDAWAPSWPGARQQFTATARDANGYPVPGVEFNWGSSNPDVAAVDAGGVATALSPGTAHLSALSTVGGGEATVTADFSVPLEGVVYTVWFARSDSAPALLVDDSLVVRNVFDEPPATTPWGQRNISKFQWSGDRIGLLTDVVGNAGNLRVRDRVGDWVDLVIGDAVDFQLSGNLVAVVTSGGELMAKDGTHGPWTSLSGGGVLDWQVAGGRYFGLVDGAGKFWAKDGIHGAWAVLATSGVREIRLERDLVGYLSESGSLAVKQGIHGIWRSTGPVAGNITQFRLLVDVPVPPARTTPASYATKQAECAADLGGAPCTSPWEFGAVPIYGRYCGLGIPADEYWDAAEDAGPIDALDVACRHHDFAGPWYPEAPGFAACIVNYAVNYSRLTQNGVLLTHGEDSQANWDAAWGNMMPNLKSAVEAYFDYTDQCPLTDFTEDTASQN